MRRPRLIPLVLAVPAFLLLAARSALGQWQVTGEAGVSHLRQPGLGESNATTAGGSAQVGNERFAFRTSALAAFTGAGRGTGQWIATGIVATPERNAWSLQTLGSISAFGQSNLAPTSSADGVVQLRLGDAWKSVAIGGGTGVTSHNAVNIPDLRAVVSGLLAGEDDRFSLDASLTRTRAVFGESSILVDNSLVYENFLDVGGSLRHTAEKWSLGASGGVRARQTAQRDDWHSFDGELWVAPRLSLAASVGRTIEDLVRGVPWATYATLALRLSSARHSHLFASGADGPRLVASRVSDQLRRIELLGVRATRVEIMADFTDWNPVPLERAGTLWRLDRVIASGPHRLAIRVDGGEWTAPPNLPKLTDDLGGAMGLITIP